MLSTYPAILRGQILEWLQEKPPQLNPNRAVSVHVTILEEAAKATPTEQGRRMAAALAQLAQLRSEVATVDPLLWERDVRRERTLPGRNADVD